MAAASQGLLSKAPGGMVASRPSPTMNAAGSGLSGSTNSWAPLNMNTPSPQASSSSSSHSPGTTASAATTSSFGLDTILPPGATGGSDAGLGIGFAGAIDPTPGGVGMNSSAAPGNRQTILPCSL